MDYLFQSYEGAPPDFEREGVDIGNRTLTLMLTRAVSR